MNRAVVEGLLWIDFKIVVVQGSELDVNGTYGSYLQPQPDILAGISIEASVL